MGSIVFYSGHLCWVPSWGHWGAWQKQVRHQSMSKNISRKDLFASGLYEFILGGPISWWWTRTLPYLILRWAKGVINLLKYVWDVSDAIFLQDTLKSFIRRDDIDIILINQNVAEMVIFIFEASWSFLSNQALKTSLGSFKSKSNFAGASCSWCSLCSTACHPWDS